MIQIIKKTECCGCTACVSVCPRKCISMEVDAEGFGYPKVDMESCVDCGLCEKVCPLKNDSKKSVDQSIYGLRNKDEHIVQESTSGGGFFAIARFVVEQGGIVYGAAYDAEFKVVHCSADNLNDCRKFHGAKYVESIISDSLFLEIQQVLKKGRMVLFSGTPCQVDGLKRFLRKPYDNLITVDLVCSSVTSPMIFSDYIRFVQRKKQLKSINMRWKGEGWSHSTQRLVFMDGTDIIGKGDAALWHTIAFSHIANRPSCHECRYTNFNRPGDFTLGDFWGIEKSYPEFFDDRGVSLFMVNTDKGHLVLKQIEQTVFLLPTDKTICLQPRLKSPVKPNADRSRFWEEYASEKFEKISRKYWRYGFWNQEKYRMRKILSFIYHSIKRS